MTSPDDQIFRDVYYCISPSFSSQQKKDLTTLLNTAGGTPLPASASELTHFITTTLPSHQPIDVLPKSSTAHLVTPKWVERSALVGLQDPAYFSPDPSMIFSGVSATATDLSQADIEVLSAGITALGGQWRTGLTKEVTHLFALTTGSLKYETAMHYKEEVGITILVPHWFDDSVRLGIRGLSTAEYEWPEPRVFKVGWGALQAAGGVGGMEGGGIKKEEKKDEDFTEEKRALYDTVLLSPGSTALLSDAPPGNVWNGHKILLSSCLGLTRSQRKAHEADIKREGGVVVEWATKVDELEVVDKADILVTRYRSGPVYVKAYRLNKTIGTLPWLWYVRSTGTLSHPTEQLLHYPIPRRPIENFSNQMITVTNYTGKDREYLKRMIATLGGEFTPSMSAKNTVVIAAFTTGTKVQRARSWSIPMVNHLWLEDCFSQWRVLSLNDPRYTCFPPGLDLSSEIGRRGIKISHDAVELDLLAKESGTTATASTAGNGSSAAAVVGNEDVGTLKKAGSLKKVVAASVLSDGTASAKEVEDVVEFEGTDGDDDIFMDVDPEPQVRKEKGKKVISGDEMDVDIDSGDNQRAKDSSSPKKNQKPKSSSKSLVPSPSKSKNKHLGTVLVTSSDEHDARAASNKPSSSKSGTKTAAQGRSNAAELWRQDEVEVEHSQKRSNIKETRPVGRTAKRIQSEEEDSDAVFLIGPPVTPKKYTPKTPQNPRARNKSHSKSRPVDEDIDMDDIQVVSPIRKKSRARKSTPRAPSRSSPVRTRSQSRTRKPVAPPLSIDDTEDDNEHEEPPRQRTLQRAASKSNTENDDEAPRGRPLAKASSVKSAGRTPRRHSSQAYVSLPTNKEIKQRERERSRHGTPARPIGRKESTDVEDISPKRGRPPGRTLSRTQSKSKSKSKTRPVVEVETLSELSPSPSPSPVPQRFVKPKTPHRGVVAEAGPSKKVLDTPSTVGRTPSRRSAATKATQRLRDEIMPDVLSFQKQMKRGVVKGSWEEKERTNDKEKFKGKGKKRLSVEDDDDGGTSIVGETDDEREKKKRKIEVPSAKKGRKGKSKGKNEGEGGDDDVSMMDEGDSRRPQKATKKLGSSKLSGKISTTDPRTIRIMTTQVTFSDDVTKAMTKMGVKFTSKPSECTHLVARTLVRTEKFLCAMAVAPIVVTDKWVSTCAATKHILLEDDYLLEDPENEAKFGFKLFEALQRAKSNGGRLFEGMTFHVTPKVKVDTKLLKNVVNAGGGQLVTQTPTHRALTNNKNRFVISCPEDQSIWRPLAENGHAIYNTELILTGMLSQKLDWESSDKRLSVRN